MSHTIRELKHNKVYIWVRYINEIVHSVVILPTNALYSPLFFDGGGFTNRFLQDISNDIADLYAFDINSKSKLSNVILIDKGGFI